MTNVPEERLGRELAAAFWRWARVRLFVAAAAAAAYALHHVLANSLHAGIAG